MPSQARSPHCFSAVPVLLVVVSILALSSRAAAAPDIFVTPIPNAPFRAWIHVERAVVMLDGSVVREKTMRLIGRDGLGRIHNETRSLVPQASVVTPPVLGVLIYDPQSRLSTMLDARSHTYRSFPVERPPATVPPALLASPSGSGLPANPFTREQDLGIATVSGVSAHGVRETQTIPADQSGTGKDVVVTDEYWYSEDLRINVRMRHDDPRTGTVTLTVTNIDQNDPDPTLFQIPAGYKPSTARGL